MPESKYDIDDMTGAMINSFSVYHPPFGDQVERYEFIRQNTWQMIRNILRLCPPSAERTLAIRKFQEGIMWANASIAVNEAMPMPADVELPTDADKVHP